MKRENRKKKKKIGKEFKLPLKGKGKRPRETEVELLLTTRKAGRGMPLLQFIKFLVQPKFALHTL